MEASPAQRWQGDVTALCCYKSLGDNEDQHIISAMGGHGCWYRCGTLHRSGVRGRQQQRHTQCEFRSWLRCDQVPCPSDRTRQVSSAASCRHRIPLSVRHVLSEAFGPGPGVSSLDASSDAY